MADRTLTINHADGGSETYTLKTEDVLGVRSMSVDGETVTIDRTAPDLIRTIIADGQTITIDDTREGLCTLTVDGEEITINRTEAANVASFLQQFTGSAAAYSLRDLAGSGNTTVVRVRRASDNSEKDFSAADISSGAMTGWVNSQIVPPLDIRELDSNGERTGALVEAAAAYSLRNLSSSYTGDVVVVRRSSDDAEELFTAAEVADGTLTTWVGAGNDGYVVIWYDQSGNGNHATQTTNASQPKIVDGGSLVTRGGNSKPSILFGGAADNYLDVVGRPLTRSVFSTLQASNTNFETLICDTTDNSPRLTTNNAANNRAYKLTGFGTPSVNIDGVTYNGTSSVSSFGFHLLGMTSVTGSAIDRIGANPAVSATGNSFNFVSELILYPDDQSDNRTALEANIGETYNIDLPSGVDTGYDEVDGFVETWYDQSGNGNDAVQEVAGSQPKIVDAGALVTGGIDFDGVNDHFDFTGGKPITSIDAASAFFVGSSDSSSNQCGLNISSSTSSRRFYLPILHSGSFRFGYAGSISAVSLASSNTSEHLFTGIAGTFTAVGYYDGELKGIVGSGTGVSGAEEIGSIGSAYRWDGRMREIIIYPSDQSANREAIEANINNQYDIY